MAGVLRKELKQQEQQKTNAKAFVAAVKKYTDMQELDAAVLREFIDRIEVSHADKKSLSLIHICTRMFFSRSLAYTLSPSMTAWTAHAEKMSLPLSCLLYTSRCV